MSEPDDELPGEPGLALRADGNLTGEHQVPKDSHPPPPKTPPPRIEPLSSTQKFRDQPRLEALTTGDLELVKRPVSSGTYEEPVYRAPAPPKGRSRKGPVLIIVALLVLAVGALLAAYRFPALGHALPVTLPAPSRHQLVVLSDPEGAKVKVGETVVGETPWAGDNVWTGKTELTLSLPGYAPWKTTINGGDDVTVDATLKKR